MAIPCKVEPGSFKEVANFSDSSQDAVFETAKKIAKKALAGEASGGRKKETNSMAYSIRKECDIIANFLCEKNKAYGNSVAEPCNIFSMASAKGQLAVRIDDKINRIRCGGEYPGDDTVLDLIGYLILYRIVCKGE
jgi:hypothetical protein